jgi:septum formation protein
MILLLGSASPRRRALLEGAGVPVRVLPTHLDEAAHPGEASVTLARRLALAKAAAVPGPGLRLGADTVVHRGPERFDKPSDRAMARRHLQALAGGWHEVTTAVALGPAVQLECFHVTTAVRFRPLSTWEIERYLETGEADDKAGAYGIQGAGGAFVAAINGSYTNVIGLPLEEVLPRLAAYRGDAEASA